ncbi:MAG: rhomboid family intramembrane serine protease [Candidatus Promineifilaceae bacterium]
MANDYEKNEFGEALKIQGTILGGFVVSFWFLEIADRFLFHGSLDALGIRPRTVDGLWGILFGPFLHLGFAHVLANTAPFVVLGWFVMLRRLSDFVWVTAVAGIISGLGTWLIGPANSVHIGASGIIFGYFGFLVMRGYFERSFSSIMWAIVVIFLYGGLIWGVLPQDNGVSWQGHLFGFIGGGVAANWLANRSRPAPLDDQIHIL